ncbi:Polymerase/histidinol phosphatase-like protein [Boletus edulis]|nr:Polymerase/histidinol phosphatase-like protein [Boletus edulis]
MPFSHHSHSGQFCRHASGTLEEVVLEAIRLGFEVYGLTEHVPRYRPEDLYPEERPSSSRSNDLENLSTLLSEHPGRIEYIVGSIHHVNAIPIDFDHTSFKMALRSCSPTEVPVAEMNATAQCRMDNFLSNYLDAHYRLLERFRPEIIGHLDLCRLYNPNLRFSEFPNAWSKIKTKLNAAALRKGWQTPYPGEGCRCSAWLILELGGRLALSDDSHGPHRVGENYSRVRDYLRQLGVKELWYLTRTPDGSPFERGLSATCVTDDWWKHDFWDRCTPSGQT